MPERGSKTSTVPVIRANFEFFRRDPNDFLSRLVNMDETWLYHYDPETKQQSMEWRHSGSPRPAQKNSECKNPLEKFSPRLFWDQDGILLTDYLPKGQNIKRGVLLISAGAMEGHFEIKTPAAGRSPRGSCSCTAMPRLTGHLQPRRNWPTWASSVLITHPILRIWPNWTTTCSLD